MEGGGPSKKKTTQGVAEEDEGENLESTSPLMLLPKEVRKI